MNVSTFISIVRECLHEGTSLTDLTCQIDQKKNKTAVVQCIELKQFVCTTHLGGLSAHNLHKSKSLWGLQYNKGSRALRLIEG